MYVSKLLGLGCLPCVCTTYYSQASNVNTFVRSKIVCVSKFDKRGWCKLVVPLTFESRLFADFWEFESEMMRSLVNGRSSD